MNYGYIIVLMNAAGPCAGVIYERDCGYVLSRYYGNYSRGHIFETAEQAKAIFDSILAQQPSTSRDGTIYPPDDLHRGFGLSNAKLRDEGVLTIQELQAHCKQSQPVIAEIKKPKSATYEY